MTIHQSRWTGAAIFVALAGAGLACTRTQPAASASYPPSGQAPAATGGAPAAPPTAGGGLGRPSGQPSAEGEDDAELVVSRDVVAGCPALRLVRAHMHELDQDMVWLAVLESIAECMGENGPMSHQNLGVSGDEEHRHIVREVLGTHGIAPTRVIAKPSSAEGAAECQGGAACGKRVEVTIVAP